MEFLEGARMREQEYYQIRKNISDRCLKPTRYPQTKNGTDRTKISIPVCAYLNANGECSAGICIRYKGEQKND